MRDIIEIIINKASISVLDKENGQLITSENEVELTETAYMYLENHILKLFKNDNARRAIINKSEGVTGRLSAEVFEDEDKFMDNTHKLAQYLYKCNSNDEHETSGDFISCLFESHTGRYLALMKLDFSETYSHYFRDVAGKADINVTVNKTSLPGPGQKVTKAAIIKEQDDGESLQILVIEKDWESSFIQSFLKCEFRRDKLENTKIFKAIAEKYARRAFRDNAQEAERFRQKISELLINENAIDIEKLVDETFQDNISKMEFKAAIQFEGLNDGYIQTDREWAERKLKRKRLKVDKSIEVYIDVEAYKDKDRFQIKSNGDGTIDIILRNIRNYIEK